MKVALADLPLFQESIYERLDQSGIKLVPAVSEQFPNRGDRRESLTIDPVTGHGVVGVGYGDDSGLARNLLAFQTIWIPGAVVVFLMGQYNLADLLVRLVMTRL